uniref:DNA replication licensing factor MCM7 n=1 Tax=Panagrellus redivivus TaxID=6233 RepID=A0A7E4UM18_PANRE
MSILDYDQARERFTDFFQTFIRPDENGDKTFVYADKIRSVAHREETAVFVDLDDVQQHDEELYDAIRKNSSRYHLLAYDVVDKLVQDAIGDNPPPVKDALDAFLYQRVFMENQQHQAADGNDGAANNDAKKKIPAKLMRRFELYFRTPDVDKNLAAREILAEHVGKLVTMRGVVIRASEVMPLVNVITYLCDACGCEVYQDVNGPTYSPTLTCPSKDCQESKANGRLELQLRGSSFLKYQEVRVQEMSDQVPVGSIPRALTIRVTGENTRLCQPGDHIKVCGILLPQLRTGYKNTGGALVADVFLDCHSIENMRMEEDKEITTEFSEEEIATVSRPDIYELLAYSIAPEIFGHTDVKKSLLLALVGGVDKNTNGMKIRGALNIILVGDPGVAKSQLLGYVDRLAVRSQYTTGRGSSGVGLTAAVVKDPVTGEMTLEGGALVLADRGICCIDEFDKMLESDRTAIHEVMEQQTISISKAGINTSLNARVSILAAANPAFGRYNSKKTVEENVQLPAALLSRFDLLWLIQDVPDQENDKRIAEHIAYVHMKGHEPETNLKPLSMQLIRRYIALCKKHNPVIPSYLQKRLVEKYVELRENARENMETSVFTSPRNLLAVVRMATAHARLHLREKVEECDIDEALRLLDACKASIESSKDVAARRRPKDPVDVVFDLIRSLLDADSQSVARNKLIQEVEQRGLTGDAVDKCLQRYPDVLTVDHGRILCSI